MTGTVTGTTEATSDLPTMDCGGRFTVVKTERLPGKTLRHMICKLCYAPRSTIETTFSGAASVTSEVKVVPLGELAAWKALTDKQRNAVVSEQNDFELSTYGRLLSNEERGDKKAEGTYGFNWRMSQHVPKHLQLVR
jgi:hypothetical protein